MTTVKSTGTHKLTEAGRKRLEALAKRRDSAIDYSDIPDSSEAFLAKAKIVRGGARPGSGRKPAGHVRLSLSVAPSVKSRLTARAKREGKTVSSLVEELAKR